MEEILKEAKMLISNRPQNVTLASTSTIAKTAAREKFELGPKNFMGADFNAAAGLPAEFKIHKSTLDEFVEVSHKNTAWNATLHKNSASLKFPPSNS